MSFATSRCRDRPGSSSQALWMALEPCQEGGSDAAISRLYSGKGARQSERASRTVSAQTARGSHLQACAGRSGRITLVRFAIPVTLEQLKGATPAKTRYHESRFVALVGQQMILSCVGGLQVRGEKGLGSRARAARARAHLIFGLRRVLANMSKTTTVSHPPGEKMCCPLIHGSFGSIASRSDSGDTGDQGSLR